MNAPFKQPKTNLKVEKLLILEAKVREASSLSELQFLIANETRKLISCRQVVVHRHHPFRTGWRIEKISSISQVDRNAPLIKSLNSGIKEALDKDCIDKETAILISLNAVPQEQAYPFRQGAYFPFKNRHNQHLGGMTLLSDHQLSEHDLALATRLSSTYAHAWSAIKPASRSASELLSKRNLLIAIGLICLAGFIPVPLTVLAPVEVVARDAFMITAPIEGVIEEVHVSPNTQVKEGELLLSYNALDFKNRSELATRNMAIASARYKRASQSSFGGGDGRRELAITKAEYELAVEEKAFADVQLELVEITSPRDGVILFSSKDDWVGRPVAIGERIMRVADPKLTEFKIKLSTSDAIILDHETSARIFLDTDPLNPLPARITVKSYAAEKTPQEPLAFPLTAQLEDGDGDINSNPRIGLRGTAQISGEKVPLVFNLIRKPLSAIRQYLGI